MRGRHRAYSEEHDYFTPKADGRIFDRFDAYPDTTVHFVAELGGLIVGGVRYCVGDERVGLPVDEFFDFSPYVRDGDRIACGSLMFVTRDASRRGIATRLIITGESWAAERDASVIVGIINPEIATLFGRLGYNPVDGTRYRADGVPFCPVLKRLAGTVPAALPRRIDIG
jgi:GNAT superfamily N-acetyltransferase